MQYSYLKMFREMLDDDWGISMDAAEIALRLAQADMFGEDSLAISTLFLYEVEHGEGRVFLEEDSE